MNNFEFKFFSTARQDVVRIVMLMVILMIAHIKAQELKITSLIDQPILILEKHNFKIQIGYINRIHEVNITEIENTMHLLTEVAFRPTNSPLSIIAKHKVRNLYSNFNLIRPRKRLIRSVEAIGSVWKWIGGSPDAHDLKIINSTMNDLIESNNQQFLVNENLGMKIKNLTNEMKQMIENRNDILLNELDMLTAIINIDTINKILEDIQEAISLSKMSITSSKLLSPREIAIIQQLLEDQGVKSDIPDEIISYVTPKIAVNNNKLLYILKVPELQKEESKVIEILALNHNNSLIKDYPRQLVKQKKKLYRVNVPIVVQFVVVPMCFNGFKV